MVREKRELQRAFSIKEKHEKLLANLDALKAKESTPDDLFNSMKTEYQQSMEHAIEIINRVKKKLAEDIQAEEINIQRQNQELQNLDTRFKVGEITADNLQKAEQRYNGRCSDLRPISRISSAFRPPSLLPMWEVTSIPRWELPGAVLSPSQPSLYPLYHT
jgi:hypothetical protein